jgi:hypothetical protein
LSRYCALPPPDAFLQPGTIFIKVYLRSLHSRLQPLAHIQTGPWRYHALSFSTSGVKKAMKTTILASAIVAALLVISGSAWAQQAAPATETPNADKPPMQAQELSRLVPRDSSQPTTADISRENADSAYRFDKNGTNCSLYPSRCQNGDDY